MKLNTNLSLFTVFGLIVCPGFVRPDESLLLQGFVLGKPNQPAANVLAAGKEGQVTLTGVADGDAAGSTDVEMLDLHDALERLEQLDPRQARIVEMSFFGGMSGEEIAAQLGVHRNTVVRDLRMARAWLQRELGRG